MNVRILGPALLLVILTAFATTFAMLNYNNRVKVWPLMQYLPLTLVIGISFMLGVGVCALIFCLLHHHRMHGFSTTASGANQDSA